MTPQHISHQLGELNGKMDMVLEDLKELRGLEARIRDLEMSRAKANGWMAGVSAMVAAFVSFLFKMLGYGN